MAANRNKLLRSAGRATDADVSICVEYNPDPEKLYRKFEQGRNLTDAEIGVLIRSGKLGSGDVEELQDGKNKLSHLRAVDGEQSDYDRN